MGRCLAVIRAGALIAAVSMFALVISPVKAGGETSTRDALRDYDKGNPIAVAYLQGLRTGLEWLTRPIKKCTRDLSIALHQISR